MIKLFQKYETDKYIIIKILFIKITFKKKNPKSDIDAVVWWIPFKSLRDAVRKVLIRMDNIQNQINDLRYNLSLYNKKINLKINDSSYCMYLNYDKEILKKVYPPYISIIVPIFNIGKEYLTNCLNSLINQTLKEIEIILINDCSINHEDDIICKEYALRDKRIKYIKHKENKGSGRARMTGLKEATGYAIGFVDPDDMISHNHCEIVVSQMLKNNVDIVSFDYYWVENKMDYYVSEHRYDNNFIYGKFIFETLCSKEKIYGQLWDKIYKKDLLIKLGDNLIPEKISGQDQAASFKIMYNANSFLYIPVVLYHHNRHPESITETNTEKFIKDRYKIAQYIVEYSLDNNIFDLYKENVEDYLLYTIISSLSYFINKKLQARPELTERLNGLFVELIIYFLDNNYISKERFELFILKLSSGEIQNNYLFEICLIVKKNYDNNINTGQKSYGVNILNFTNKSGNFKTVALYFDAGIGDYLMLRPLLPFIRKYYSSEKIIFIGNNRFDDVVCFFDKDYIDEYIYYDGDNKYAYDSKMDFFKNICYDVLISPYYLVNEWVNNNLSLIKAKEKIASFGGLIAMSQRQRVKTAQNYTKIIYPSENDMFELYRNIEFFENLFNEKIVIDDISIDLKEEDFNNIDFNFNERYAIIFPSATDINRQWNYKNFQLVCEHLYKKYKIVSYIAGSESDKALANKIIGNRKYIISICGKYKLHEVFYIFNKSKIVVTNDSGGYHIAMSVSDNIIVISSGANFIRFTDYPKQFKENKIISTPIPDKAKEFKYIEYYYDRDFLNTISAKTICDLIDDKHCGKLNINR